MLLDCAVVAGVVLDCPADDCVPVPPREKGAELDWSFFTSPNKFPLPLPLWPEGGKLNAGLLEVCVAGCWFSFCFGAPKRELAGGLPAGVVDGNAGAVLLACGVLVPLCEAALPPPRLLKRPPEDGAEGLAPPPKRLLVP